MGVVSARISRGTTASINLTIKVINPAERNALVGIKPTVGLTSRAGYAFPMANARITLPSLSILN